MYVKLLFSNNKFESKVNDLRNFFCKASTKPKSRRAETNTQFQFEFSGITDFCNKGTWKIKKDNNNVITYSTIAAGGGSVATPTHSNCCEQSTTNRKNYKRNNNNNTNWNNNNTNQPGNYHTNDSPKSQQTTGTRVRMESMQSQLTSMQ